MSENLAIDDALYYLEQALSSSESSFDLQGFLAESKSLSRQQFICKAQLHKIHDTICSYRWWNEEFDMRSLVYCMYLQCIYFYFYCSHSLVLQVLREDEVEVEVVLFLLLLLLLLLLLFPNYTFTFTFTTSTSTEKS